MMELFYKESRRTLLDNKDPETATGYNIAPGTLFGKAHQLASRLKVSVCMLTARQLMWYDVVRHDAKTILNNIIK